MSAGTVKPLVWKVMDGKEDGGREHYGKGVFGHWYCVSRVKTGVWSIVHHVDGKAVHLDLSASREFAKAAAQADYEARMLAQIETPVSAWLTIESAPKDGRAVIVMLDEGEIIVARFSTDELGKGWWNEHASPYQSWADANATHWMPLPAPPSTKEGGEA